MQDSRCLSLYEARNTLHTLARAADLGGHQHATDERDIYFWYLSFLKIVHQMGGHCIGKCSFYIQEKHRDDLTAAPRGLDGVRQQMERVRGGATWMSTKMHRRD